MSQVVFDIETVGKSFDSFSKDDQEYLLKYAKTEEEKEEYKLRTALSPLTGSVVAIGYYLPSEKRSLVEMVSDGQENYERENTSFKFLSSEKELLESFWQIILKCPQIVTFNGRGFDVPFLMIRSAVCKVQCSRNLMPYRYDHKIHLDLADQMSFYGALRYPKTLHFYTQAFGIKTPKDEMKGHQVTEFYNEGKHKEIAEYCLKDVIATAELFDYWERYLRFK